MRQSLHSCILWGVDVDMVGLGVFLERGLVMALYVLYSVFPSNEGATSARSGHSILNVLSLHPTL